MSNFSRKNAVCCFFSVIVLSSPMIGNAITPSATWWGDSYAVDNDQDGVPDAGSGCYCVPDATHDGDPVWALEDLNDPQDRNFDHGLGAMMYQTGTSSGEVLIPQICIDLGKGNTDPEKRVWYNDVQCGNGPDNGEWDEQPDACPAVVNAAPLILEATGAVVTSIFDQSGEVKGDPSGCLVTGPTWDLESIYGPQVAQPANGIGPLDRTSWVVDAISEPSWGSFKGQAVDGDAASRWGSNAAQTPGQWYLVDFGSKQSFDRVQMDVSGLSTNDYGNFPAAYNLYATSDLAAIDAVKNSNDFSGLGAPLASGNGAITTVIENFGDHQEQYMVIEQTGSKNDWWSIGELTVHYDDVDYNGVGPLDRTSWVLNGDTTAWQGLGSNGTDGDPATRVTSGRSQAPGHYFYVDFGQIQRFDRIVLDSSVAGQTLDDHAVGFEVYVTNDLNDWGTLVASGAGASPETAILMAEQTAQYVKIQLTGSIWRYLSFGEIGIFNDAALNGYGELNRGSWNLSATNSSQWDPLTNVRDGDVASHWKSGMPQQSGDYCFTVNFPVERIFNRIEMVSTSTDYPHSYSMEAVTSSGTESIVANQTGSASISQTFADKTATAVNICQLQTAGVANWFAISELNIYYDE